MMWEKSQRAPVDGTVLSLCTRKAREDQFENRNQTPHEFDEGWKESFSFEVVEESHFLGSRPSEGQ